MKQPSRALSKSPVTPNTLVDLLRWRADQHRDHLAYKFLQDGESEVISITYGELDRRARAIGAWFESLGASGERALLLYPPGLDYIASFFGCLYARVTAVPAYPPRLNRPVPRIQAIVADSQASFALTTTTILNNIEQRFEHAPDLQALHWINTEDAPDGLEADWHHPTITPDTLAFLQYTSGSTSQPKGVMLCHGNLMHNLKAIRHGFQIDSDGLGVFWLPSYHDMGLIGGILEPMYVGGLSVLMSPVSFLQRPVRWLQAITRFRGTISGAPNFAYDLCVDKITPEQLEILDLSSWSLAFCGAEPVRPETLERFARTFEVCGFRRTAFYPCYGLAEGALLVSGGEGPSTPRTFTLNRTALERDLVVPASPDEENSQTIVACGQAIIDQQIVIVNPDTLERCASSEVGEIWVSGPSVARGYWNLPDETRRTFHAYPAGSSDSNGGNPNDGPFLRTGDLGFLRDGQLFITGRLKDLIIIHGRNHYPQDIELTVESSHPALQPGAGAAFAVTQEGEERLVIVQEVSRKHRRPDVDEVVKTIRQAVAENHDLQVHAVVLVKPLSIPKTSSGKIKRHACRAAFLEDDLQVVGEWRAEIPVSSKEAGQRESEETGQHESASAPERRSRSPLTRDEQVNRSQAQIQAWLVENIAGRQGLDPVAMDPRQPFTAYGLGSIQAVELTSELEIFLGRSLSPTLAWDYPTIESLASHLARELSKSAGEHGSLKSGERKISRTTSPGEPIAIVGMGCRFPGAPNPQAFWQLLRQGVDAIREVPADRWDVDAVYAPDPATPGKLNTRWGGFLDQVDQFDPHFFGISPREAARMDPQQRLLLEVAWEALESAGIPPLSLAGSRTGVYVGISSYDYSSLQFGDASRIDAYAGIGNAHSIAANRLSYVLDLRGPSMSVDTACSSSLVSVHLGCQSLRAGESDLVLAGGVNLILTPDLTITFSQARMLAPDGRCKTFDARADGYVRSEGCGVVVLKRFSDALRDGDRILALIQGSAVNQDGRSNGLTAPNGPAQQAVIRQALDDAQVSPEQIQYVETHGTGTPLGDPIEVAALRSVLEADHPSSNVLMGSVKTNLGHLEAAAGIAGLIKVALALVHEAIPPHLHLKEINPYLPLEGSRLEISTYLRPWKRGDRPRIAGVSSFGFGGTNAHVVLSEAPPSLSPASTAPESALDSQRPVHILTLSARTDSALQTLAQRTASHLETAHHSLADMCFTANAGRSHFSRRLAIIGRSPEQIQAGLESFVAGRKSPGLLSGSTQPGARPKIAFLFTGQGSQYAGMGRQLYQTQPVFRAALERCARILEPMLERPLLEVIYPSEDLGGDEQIVDQTSYTQPALFALEYALAELWRSWGIEPHAVMGHSVGEYVAACIAGVFSLQDGLRLIAARGRLMGALPPGGAMAAVFSSAERVAGALEPYRDQASIAATNGPENTVISGSRLAVDAVVEKLEQQGISARSLNVSHAFHSPLMAPIMADFSRTARQVNYAAPRIPLVSNLTGQILAAGQVPDADYWSQHIREEVRFSAGMLALAGLDADVFLEIGPGPVLLGMGRRCLDETRSRDIAWLPSLRPGQEDWQVLLASLGKLYVLGAEVDWAGFETDMRQKISLPTYPFERQRYWLTAGPEVKVQKEPASGQSEADPGEVSISLGGAPVSASDGHQPETVKPSAQVKALDRQTLLAAGPVESQDVLEKFLHKQAARILGMDPECLDLHQPLDTLGLDSLMAIEIKNSLESSLGVNLQVASLLKGPTIAGLAAEAFEALGSPALASGTALTISSEPADEYPLSYGQQALWFLHQLLPQGVSFNVAGAVRILGELDVPALQRAFQQLVARHDALRSTFHMLVGEPVQRVHADVEIRLQLEDATGWDRTRLHKRLVSEARRPFDLENGPVLRALLLSRGEEHPDLSADPGYRPSEEIPGEHILVLAMNHIVTDFWSMTVLARDLLALYQANHTGTSPSLSERGLAGAHYSDYVRWQAELLASQRGEQLWDYWQRQIGEDLPVLDLPTDRPRPPLQTYRGDSEHLYLDRDLTEKIKALAQEHGVTLFMALLAAFELLLHRYSGQQAFLVGSVTAGRNQAELADLVGYFINPVALRADFSQDPTFDELLQRVRQTVLEAFEHQDYPPALLAKRLNLPRDPSRPPLFETMFIFQKAQQAEVQALSPFALGINGARMQIDDLVLESISLGGEPAQFDLTMMVAENGNGLAAALQYNADLFDAGTIQRMLGHFQSLLEGIVSNPHEPVSTYPLLRESEREQLLHVWNQTQVDYPRQLCIHELVQKQVERSPEAIAVQFEDQSLTYRELEQHANRLSSILIDKGVGPGTLVGIFVERSLEMLVGMLAVLKAGGAYLPLDPAFPQKRLAFMLADSQASFVLTQTNLLPRLPEHRPGSAASLPQEAQLSGIQVISLHQVENAFTIEKPNDARHADGANPDDLAYVIYTSGSTGMPKGVQITHRAVVNFLNAMRRRPGLNSEDTLLAVTTLSFDIAVLELLLPLITGARLVIASAEVAVDGALLADALTSSQATVMQATPATWRSLLEAGWQGKEDLKMLCGGEALPGDLAARLLKRGEQLWNLYGPTETTVWSTVYQVILPEADAGSGQSQAIDRSAVRSISIGRPIANTQVFLLDQSMKPVPIGVPGDLYIGGDGLSRGYLNRPELTAQRFIPNPYRPQSLIYKTGDIARYLADGNLEFLGRSDQQVKVRGFRIEPGEVEVALAEHPAVRQAVVVAWKERSTEASLVAYLVSEDDRAEVDPGELRAFLRQKLPEYMLPSYFITLESLPLTPNGKVDRKALRPPTQARPDLRAPYVAPRTPLERELAQLCAQVLELESEDGQPAVGVYYNFFDLGGHSLLGTRLVFLLREKYQIEGRDLPLRTLFEQPTVAGLAEAIEAAKQNNGSRDVRANGRLQMEALKREAQLDPTISTAGLSFDPAHKPDDVLLTGATGFIGAFLLHRLLQETTAQVSCLVRAEDVERASLRLQRNLEAYNLWDETFTSRIRPVLGDLSEPLLGLSEHEFGSLAERVAVIYHNGALVNFIYPYQAHKAINVLGTQEVLRLAGQSRLKPVHFVSTLSIFHHGEHDDGRIYHEDEDLDQIGVPFGGYAQSKWVAEKLVLQAGLRGIPYAIYRPGLVSGHSRTGAWNPADFMSSLTRICMSLGSVPDLEVMLNVVPVNYISASIVNLSLNPKNLGRVYHLDNPQPQPVDTLVKWLADQGYPIRKVSFARWKSQLFDRVASMPEAGWGPFLPLIEEVREEQVFMPRFDCSNTLAGLEDSGIHCPPVGPELFSIYLKYFTKQGLLETPEH